MRRGKNILAGAACAALALGLAAPGQASITGAGVRAGHNLSVFHTIDFIGVFGYSVGTPMTIDVVRDGHVISSVTAPTISTVDGGGLELNHGPLGAPAPGDCFDGFTPDVRPGDVVRVTADGGTDEVTVDNILIQQGPVLEPGGDITVKGIAERFDGTPIDVAELNSGEVRNTSRFRGTPTSVVRTAGTANGWTATYAPPYNVERNRNGLDELGRRDAILFGDHAMGFGHVVPLPADTQVADGVGETPGPALGCEASPAARSAVGASSTRTINLDTLAAAPGAGDTALTLSGPAVQDATAGTVTLSNGSASTTAPVEGLSGGASGDQGWSARFTRAQVEGLADGTLTASLSLTTGGGDVTGASKSILKDTVAPTIEPSLPPGAYTGVQRIMLNAPGADSVTYRTDGQPATPSDSLFVANAPIQLGAGTQTLTALAVDAAGNRTAASFNYEISEPAAAPARAVAPVVVTPAPKAVTKASSRSLPVRNLSVRISKRHARASMRLAKGTRVVRLSIYRKLRGNALELVHRELRLPGKGGSYQVRLRRALGPGRYLLTVTPGVSEARLRAADERSRAFRVKKR